MLGYWDMLGHCSTVKTGGLPQASSYCVSATFAPSSRGWWQGQSHGTLQQAQQPLLHMLLFMLSDVHVHYLPFLHFQLLVSLHA